MNRSKPWFLGECLIEGRVVVYIYSVCNVSPAARCFTCKMPMFHLPFVPAKPQAKKVSTYDRRLHEIGAASWLML
jgi:hypothetical protein